MVYNYVVQLWWCCGGDGVWLRLCDGIVVLRVVVWCCNGVDDDDDGGGSEPIDYPSGTLKVNRPLQQL